MHIKTLTKQMFSKIVQCIAICLLFFSATPLVRAADAGVNINLIVEGCNNNLICEPAIGENVNNCPTDCTASGLSTSFRGGGGPISAGSSGGSASTLTLNALSVTTDTASAVISFDTSLPAVATLEWGSTSDKSDGSIAEVIYTSNHTFKIENLLLGTRYYFSVTAYDSLNRTVGVVNQEFTTAVPTIPPPKPLSPANISTLLMNASDTGVELSWQSGPDVSLVRVTRSTHGYAKDPFEGKVVYEGTGNSVVDSDVVSGQTYYYTIFTKGINDLYSSGAIVKSDGVSRGSGISGSGVKNLVFDTAYAEQNLTMLKKLGIANLSIVQGGKPLSFSAQNIPIDGDQNFTLSIPAEQIPDSVKDIIVTLRSEQDQKVYLSYLMALNKDTGQYEGVIPGVPKAGKYGLEIVILDYSNQVFGSINGEIIAHKVDKVSEFSNKVRQIKDGVVKSNLTFFALLLMVWAGVLKLLKTVGNFL